ncbi:hypothetical protein V5E97_03980 [Singulisphaera sp. Ch08]|uniref:Uncharacterized protein n=1 Tax=Singulisphaera sp. Ch08 TaxID=3120278 RepID=A0AAU7CIU3_9BACT
MRVDEDWKRFKELVKVESPTMEQGDEMRDLIFGLLCTPLGRERIEAGLGEPLDGKVRAISKLASALEKRHAEAGLSRDDRVRLLERLSVASFPHKEKAPYWTILWLRHEAGDPAIGRAIAEAIFRGPKGAGKNQSPVSRLGQLESWKRTPQRRRADLLEVALKTESRPDLQWQLQDALRSCQSPPRPTEVQPGSKPAVAVPIVPPRVGPGPAQSTPPERQSGELAKVQAQTAIRPEESPSSSPPVTPDSTAASRPPSSESTASLAPFAAAVEPVPVAHDPRQLVDRPAAVGGEEQPAGGGDQSSAVEDRLKIDTVRDGKSPGPTESRRKTRPPRPPAAEQPSPPGDGSDSVGQAIALFAEYLPRFETHLSAIVREVRDLGRRLSSVEERDVEIASVRDELRRVQETLRERHKVRDEDLRERESLKAANEEAAARIRAAEEMARAAEARADQHIHLANRDRENSIQNYLANLRPVLRRLLIDIGDQPQDDGAAPQTETEGILWQRLREIKQALRDQGVLLD